MKKITLATMMLAATLSLTACGLSEDYYVDDSNEDITDDELSDDELLDDGLSDESKEEPEIIYTDFNELTAEEQETLLSINGYWFYEKSTDFFAVDDVDAHYSAYQQDDTGHPLWLYAGDVHLTNVPGTFAFCEYDTDKCTIYTLSNDGMTLEGEEESLSRVYSGPYDDPSAPADDSYTDGSDILNMVDVTNKIWYDLSAPDGYNYYYEVTGDGEYEFYYDKELLGTGWVYIKNDQFIFESSEGSLAEYDYIDGYLVDCMGYKMTTDLSDFEP